MFTFLEFIKNGFYLIVVVCVAALGLQFGLYGLIINLAGSELKPATVEELYENGAGLNRYIELSGGRFWDMDLGYYDGDGNLATYVYLLTTADTTKAPVVVAVLETDATIDSASRTPITGLLKPFWTPLDEDLEFILYQSGFELAPNVYHLETNKEPWKWHWNLLILLISILFFYRLIEAIIKNLRVRRERFLNKRSERDNEPVYHEHH